MTVEGESVAARRRTTRDDARGRTSGGEEPVGRNRISPKAPTPTTPTKTKTKTHLWHKNPRWERTDGPRAICMRCRLVHERDDTFTRDGRPVPRPVPATRNSKPPCAATE